MNRRALGAVISDVLLPGVWAKQRDHWYLDKRDLIFVVNLQKSNFGGQFYLNAGIFIKPDAPVSNNFASECLKGRYEYMRPYYDYLTEYPLGKYPKQHHCDIQVRVDRMVPVRDSLQCALDLENPLLNDRQRAIVVSDAIKTYVLPVFSEIEDVESLRRYFQNKISKESYWIIPLKIKEFIDGIATPPEPPWKPKPGQVLF